jgi:S-adenosylmethionine hydrolase
VFAPAAAALASGVDAGALGTVVGECAPASWLPDVRVSRGRIDASVRYVDPFGNLMTGVTEAHLEAAFPGLDTSDIEAQLGTRPAGRLRGYYQGGDEGELIAVINSWGRVEVSIDRGRAVDAFPETPPEAMRLELRAAKG